MNETERIADQLKRAFYGEAWSGPSVKEVLDGVTPELAAKKPVANAHSIWELVLHITAWVNIVRIRAEGKTITVTEEVNFPPMTDISETSWQESLRSMERGEEMLRQTILRFSDAHLSGQTAPEGHSVYVLFHGAVQHSLYHAGQIALLKKAALEQSHQ